MAFILTSKDEERESPSPGLILILQQAVALRLIIAFLIFGIYLFFTPPNTVWLIMALFAERLLMLLIVLIPAIRQKMGTFFLPVIISLLILIPPMELAITVTSIDLSALFKNGLLYGLDAATFLVWLVVPVIIAAWQYGWKGFGGTLAALIVTYYMILPIVTSAGQQMTVYLFNSLASFCLLFLVGYVVLTLVRYQKEEHSALKEAHLKLAQRTATVEQLAETRERNRLARELHDTLAHSLTGLSLQLQALGVLIENNPTEAKTRLLEIQKAVRQGVAESRRAINALRATPLEDLGLTEALNQLCLQYAERADIHMDTAIEKLPAIDPLTETSIYRIAEAALANIEQHSSANEVKVKLSFNRYDERKTEGEIRLEITDNGSGFDPENIPKDRFGLAGIRERADLIGANLRIHSKPGQGTRINLSTKIGQKQ